MNGRKARQRTAARGAKAEHAMACAPVGQAEFVKRDGAMEVWRKGGVTLLAPIVMDDYPPELQDALTIRRKAVFSGQCPCGMRTWARASGKRLQRHQGACPASDDSIARLAAAAGITTNRVDN